MLLHRLFIIIQEVSPNIKEFDKTLRGNCNAGVAISEEKGYYGNLYMWSMEHGIANIIYIGFLEKKDTKYNMRMVVRVSSSHHQVNRSSSIEERGHIMEFPILILARTHRKLICFRPS